MKTGKVGTGLILSEVLGIIASLQNDTLVSEIQYIRPGFCYFKLAEGLTWSLSNNGVIFANITPISASCKLNRKLSYEDSLLSPVDCFGLLVKSRQPLNIGMSIRLRISDSSVLLCKILATRFDDFMDNFTVDGAKWNYYRLRVTQCSDL